MTKQNEQAAGTVRKSTLAIAVLVALGVGFYLGAMFTTVYRANQEQPGQHSAGMPPGMPGGAGGMPPAAQSGPDPKHAEEISRLTKHLAHEPDDAASWTKLGNAYFDTNQVESAIKAYEKSLALAPGDANVWTDLGVMYRRDNKPTKAVECFDKAIAADPAHEVSRFNKGTVLMHDLNDPQGALAVWEGLLVINPKAHSPGGMPVSDLVDGLKKNMESGQ